MRILLIIILTFTSTLSFSQGSSSSAAYQALADSLYNHHNYQYASIYYQKAIKKSVEPGNLMLRIARCYDKLNKMADAEVWFRRAEENSADFSDADLFRFIQTLMMNRKHDEAEVLLVTHLKTNPQSTVTKQWLDDLRHYDKYFSDSLAYNVTALSINTPQSEFAPSFYKDGLVFSASKQRGFLKKKYHWDNSHYLNLYYSSRIGNSKFKEPVLLEDKLNARFHDGPAVFYQNNERMIITRNHHVPDPGKKNGYVWHLALYEGFHVDGSKQWTLALLPFNDPAASFAHPSVSEDGTVLYFVSDMPGGYGGTDIYRIVYADGKWGKPFNLGPVINTPGNEVFPFFSGHTLYFSSDGHGGLGGLDIFSSQQTPNGFSKPVNMNYPVNSNYHDFSFIATPDHSSGYFASTRSGNDDLFSFEKRPDLIRLQAHLYDGQSNASLPGAEVQLITDTRDTIFYANENGLVQFELPREAAFILIGNKGGKTGMLSDFASNENLQPYQLAAYGDTTHVPCILQVKDASGVAARPSAVVVKDRDTNESLNVRQDQSLLSFFGKKGHAYAIEIRNEQGDTTALDFIASNNESEQKILTLSLKEIARNVEMAIQVLHEQGQQPVSHAEVKIVTFSGPDIDLKANENGVVEFTLPLGSAYMAIATVDDFTGMNSGIAEPGNDKKSRVHPIIVRGDQNKQLPLALLVTGKDGNLVDEAKAVVTNKTTGESLPVEAKEGTLTFLAERGNDYQVKVSKAGHRTFIKDISVSADAVEVEKINVPLEEKISYTISARVIRAADQVPAAGAAVKLITYETDDIDLVADSAGRVRFTLAEGMAYVAMASKDGLNGMYSGLVEPDTDSATHTIEIQGDVADKVPVVSFITGDDGEVMNDAHVTVNEKKSGAGVHTEFSDGVLSFYGEKGKSYDVSVAGKDHKPVTTSLAIPYQATAVEKLTITLNRIIVAPAYKMAARVFKDSDQAPVAGAQVKIITLDADDVAYLSDSSGIIHFTLSEGTAYVAMANKNNMSGMLSGVAEKGADENSIVHPISMVGESRPNQTPVVTFITDETGTMLSDATVRVSEKVSGSNVPSQFQEGILNFYGEKGKSYEVFVENAGQSTTKPVEIPHDTDGVEKISIQLVNKNVEPVSSLLAVQVLNEKDHLPLSAAVVSVITFDAPDLELVADEKGMVNFALMEGTPYVVMASKEGYVGMHSGIVEPGSEGTSVIHTIYAKGEPDKVPVVGLLSAYDEALIANAQLKIIDESDRKSIDFTHQQGVVTFLGEKGHNYQMEASVANMTTQIKNITVENGSNVPLQWKMELHNNSTQAGRLIIFDNLTLLNRYFLVRDQRISEIVERDGVLYLQRDSIDLKLGDGHLSNLANDAEQFIIDYDLGVVDVLHIQCIYFDFDNATLDEQDKTELDKVALLLQRSSAYQVQVSAHTDGRGSDNYNLRLSEKRAAAIVQYLRRKKISTARLLAKSYGEKVPAVPCASTKCSEDDHQKNRRAEFMLVISK